MRPLHSYRPRAALAAIAFALVCANGAAYAASPDGPPPPAFGPATPVDMLQDMTGGTDTTNNITQQTVTGTMSDTEAKNTVSGGNLVSGNAFGSSAGLPTVIQNSGNNVLIQNATVVNVRMTP
ncbi:MAG: hypothetical protein ABW193_07910 [Luteibacter sp.]